MKKSELKQIIKEVYEEIQKEDYDPRNGGYGTNRMNQAKSREKHVKEKQINDLLIKNLAISRKLKDLRSHPGYKQGVNKSQVDSLKKEYQNNKNQMERLKK